MERTGAKAFRNKRFNATRKDQPWFQLYWLLLLVPIAKYVWEADILSVFFYDFSPKNIYVYMYLSLEAYITENHFSIKAYQGVSTEESVLLCFS